MQPFSKKRGERGNTLILAMILVAVLSVIGAAAVMLSSEERMNVSAMAKYQKRLECAKAAQSVLLAEMFRSGSGSRYLESTAMNPGVELPDASPAGGFPTGTQLLVGHYGQGMNTVQVNATTFAKAELRASVTDDLTNSIGRIDPSVVHNLIAHCVDPQGNEYETEVSVSYPF